MWADIIRRSYEFFGSPFIARRCGDWALASSSAVRPADASMANRARR